MTKSVLLSESPYLLFLSVGLILYRPRIGAAVLACLLYFYRLPHREVSTGAAVVAPCDGRVKAVIRKPDGRTRIVVFLSPLDVHTQWIPCDGVVVSKKYTPGSFHPAYLLHKSRYNERCTLKIQTRSGQVVKVTQITGQLVRRIACHPKVGQTVYQGQYYGMMKFSSRVDLTLPAGMPVQIKEGQYLWGCLTAVATP